MTIDDEKLDELERCAEAATEGPWHRKFRDEVCTDSGVNPDPDGWKECPMCGGEGDVNFADIDGDGWEPLCQVVGIGDRLTNDARHIATADPPTVLALVEEVRRLREDFRRYRDAVEEVRNRCQEQIDFVNGHYLPTKFHLASRDTCKRVLEVLREALEAADE